MYITKQTIHFIHNFNTDLNIFPEPTFFFHIYYAYYSSSDISTLQICECHTWVCQKLPIKLWYKHVCHKYGISHKSILIM